MPSCQIVCLHCGHTFNSPIQFGNAEAFFTSTLVGNSVRCSNCKKMTGCNKENMKFVADDRQAGFVGRNAT
jgi:hypothetical protein